MGNNVLEIYFEINEFCMVFVKCIIVSVNIVVFRFKFNFYCKFYWIGEVKEVYV